MEFLRILEGFVTFLFFITMVTQVIIPLWNNVPIFPILNSSRKDLEKGLKVVQELEEQQRLADELRDRTNKLLNPKQEK